MMTAEQLKGSILQMAMQGKLVEQRPEEGTGEELYKEIQAEKKRLIKEGKVKKQKDFTDFKEDEMPFDIPDSWKWISLGSAISLLSGADLTPDKYNSNGKGTVYITGASCIENGIVLVNRWTEYPRNIAHKGDLLLTCKGTVGKTAVLDLDEAHIARQIMAITPILCDIGYIDYYLQFIVDSLKMKAKSMIPGIERATVLGALLPLPPLAEQKRIVAKIEELMPFVEQYAVASTKLNKLNATFPEMMKKSILQEAVQGKLVPQDPNDEPASVLLKKIAEEKKRLIKEGKIKKQKPLPEITEDEIPFDIPESWEWIRMGELITYQNGYAYKSSDMTDHGFPVIKSGNLMTLQVVIKPNNDYIANPTEKMLDSKIVKGDMLMCLSSQSNNPEPLGKTAIYSFDEPALLNQRVLKMRPIDERLTAYLYYAINSEYFHYTVSHQGGGSAQANLKLEHVLNMLIPVPPIKEQERIVVQLQKVFPNLSVLKRQVV